MIKTFLDIKNLDELKNYFDKLNELDKSIASYLFWSNFAKRK